ncbi:OmpA family protein [Edaphobacter flagellatus]|uniref:OmpA family protein n=1 Tax=Edaphobacter flagellatus TaxID=1933044 RepID=UPI0021B37DD7|nr:OmpA family protein [Edaphobacter flagellatus]
MSSTSLNIASNKMKYGSACTAALAGSLLLTLTIGCSTKNYVRSQTTPVIQQANDLDAKTASDHRNIRDTDDRAQKGIATAQGAADTAEQHAQAAGQSASTAGQSAQEAYNRVDSLSGVIANLDNYKSIADVSVTFAFDKSVLTASDKKTLDDFAASLTDKRSYILAVTGGTDSTGDANYNYGLSQRRADAVVNYLSSKYNIAPHKFYLIGIGKDQEVASNNTSAGRAKNRRVEVKLMTNMEQPSSPNTAMNSAH